MSSITTIQSIEQIPDIEELLELIQFQLSANGEVSNREIIEKAFKNSLKEGSRAVFFLWHDYKDRLGAFAFANICCGLESGGDYLWINELYVHDMFRKRGVATEILDYISRWSQTQSIVYIACSTGLKNKAARGLYEKSGYDLHSTIWVDKNVRI